MLVSKLTLRSKNIFTIAPDCFRPCLHGNKLGYVSKTEPVKTAPKYLKHISKRNPGTTQTGTFWCSTRGLCLKRWIGLTCLEKVFICLKFLRALTSPQLWIRFFLKLPMTVFQTCLPSSLAFMMVFVHLFCDKHLRPSQNSLIHSGSINFGFSGYLDVPDLIEGHLTQGG